MFRAGVEEGEKNNAQFLGLMNSKYSRLELIKVTDEAGTTTEHKTIMQKSKDFYQNLYTKKHLNKFSFLFSVCSSRFTVAGLQKKNF